MSYKIFTEGNQLILEEPSGIQFVGLSRDIIIRRAGLESPNPQYYITGVIGWPAWHKLTLSELTDASGEPYTVESFKTFYQHELGKSSAGTTAPTTPPTNDDEVGEWVRPQEWLALPELEEDQQIFTGLLYISKYGNEVEIDVAGDFTVDWGDGVIEDFIAGKASHSYEYESIQDSLLSGKQVVIKVTPQEGSFLTKVDLSAAVAPFNKGWLEIKLSGEHLNKLVAFDLTKLESVTLGVNNITDFTYTFGDCYSLSHLDLDTSKGTNFTQIFSSCYKLSTIPHMDTSNGTIFRRMFWLCLNLKNVPTLDTSNGVDFSDMFGSCYELVNVPHLNTSNGTNFSDMFNSCYSITTIPLLDTSNGTDFNTMFYACYDLETIPTIDTSNSLDFSYMFGYCMKLDHIPFFNTSKGTDFNRMFTNCTALTSVPVYDTSKGVDFQRMFYRCNLLPYVPAFDLQSATQLSNMLGGSSSIKRIDLKNIGVALDISTLNLGVDDIVYLFNNLKDLTGLTSQTIRIPTTIHGGGTLTSEQRDIAINKNWTIIG